MNYEVMEDEKRDIVKRSFKFALRIINIIGRLPKNQATLAMGSQLVRSGTSVGANVEEAKGGFSKQDFTYKMSIASKEIRESNYWLRLLYYSEIIPQKSKLHSDVESAIDESEEMKKILATIVKTSQKKFNKNDKN